MLLMAKKNEKENDIMQYSQKKKKNQGPITSVVQMKIPDLTSVIPVKILDLTSIAFLNSGPNPDAVLNTCRYLILTFERMRILNCPF